MALSQLPGQPRALEILQGAVSRSQVHHAYLFGGPEGSGKELAARLFLQALNCEKQPGIGCGFCGECTRVATFNHPDLHWIMPESELVARKLLGKGELSAAPSRQIKIDQIRKLMERLAFRALTARRKGAVLLAAETMNVPAQNALLKTLEEPPADTTIILISTAPDALLPTIRSRCLRVPFVPLPIEAVAAEVQKQAKLSPESALRATRLGQGSLQRALEWTEARLASRADLFTKVLGLKHDDARPALALAEELAAERTEAEWALGQLRLALRDALMLQQGAPPESLANGDLGPVLSQLAQAQPARLLERIRTVDDAERHLARNASPRFALERLFLSYAP
jgi:DNA polymerase-3 subunit delta'